MGFDLFLAAVSIVTASIATWALLRLFPSSDARQAIPLRTDGGFADPSHTTDGGVTIDGKVTADGESASDIDGQPTDHLGKRLVIALILTIPTFVITLLALAKIAMPGWLTNPWPHAIVITPVMFYCAAPIHHRGLPALQRRRPNGDSLVSLGMAIVYAYSLLLCVVSWIFPAGSRDPYFAFVGVVATLSLAGTLVRQHAMTAQQTAETEKAQSAQSTESTESARSQAKSPEPTQEKSAEELLFRAVVGHAIRARVLQITTSVTMVVAVWTCALWLAFGMQPKLAIAILLGSTVLSVAGLVLQAYDRQVTNR